MSGSESSALSSPTTRFELVVDGTTVPLDQVSPTATDVAEKRFRGSLSLSPGPHSLVARWFWNGSLIQTTTLHLDVRG